MLEKWVLRLGLAAAFAVSPNLIHAQSTAVETLSETLTKSAQTQRTRLDFDGNIFSGSAWKKLIAEGKHAQFFMIGEEHGIAENPKLAAALYAEMANSGYERLVIEVSPTMATKLDTAASEDGMKGLRKLYAKPGGEPAFFGMKEEAEMLSAIRTTSSDEKPIFWGVDYEVLGDRQLIKALTDMPKPAAAKTALAKLSAASDASWAEYKKSGNILLVFSFGGDPNLVRAVRDAWPERDAAVSQILHTLEETLEINALYKNGKNWSSNARRAALIRKNFIDHWKAARKQGHTPKLMAKLGSSHLVRGRSNTEAFDLGTLLPELAAIVGGHTVSMLVLPGKGAPTAVLDPATLSYKAAPAKDGYAKGLGPLTAAAFGEGFTLIDLRPLRGTKGLRRSSTNRNLLRTIMGYDMMLVMSGSTASGSIKKQ